MEIMCYFDSTCSCLDLFMFPLLAGCVADKPQWKHSTLDYFPEFNQAELLKQCSTETGRRYLTRHKTLVFYYIQPVL